MRRLFFLGLVLGAELAGCGAPVTLPAEPGPEQVQPPATETGAPTVAEAGPDGLRAVDGGPGSSPETGGVDAAPDVSADAIDAGPAAIDSQTDAAPPSTCPATLPAAAAPCALPESGVLRCYYVDAASGMCIDLAYCDGQRWGHGLVGLPDANGCD